MIDLSTIGEETRYHSPDDPLDNMEARDACRILVTLNNLLWPVVPRTTLKAFGRQWVYEVETAVRYGKVQ